MTSYVKVIKGDSNLFGTLYNYIPNWINDDGTPVNEEYLISKDIFPIEVTSDSSKDLVIYNEELIPLEASVIDFENKKVIRSKIYNLKESTAIIEFISNKIEELRNKKLFNRFSYLFPDTNSNAIVRIKSIDDINIINSLVVDALQKISNNDYSSTIYRDEDNLNHNLNPIQMIEFGKFIKSKFDEIYISSWNFKDSIKTIFEDSSTTSEQKANLALNYFNVNIINWS